MKKSIIILALFAMLAAGGCIRIKKQAASNPVQVPEDTRKAAPTDIDMLLQAGYRGAEPADFEQMFSEDWYDFYQDENTKKYFLERAEVVVERIYDDCLADSSVYVGSARNSLAMIKGLVPQNKEISSVEITKNHVWPDEEYSFTFNGKTYVFRGEGVRLSAEQVHTNNGLEMWSEVRDYKLYLYDGQNEQLLLEIPSFDDTFVEILWLGDLDEDGKPDFILDTSEYYEEKSVVLFLSSRAGEGEVAEAVASSYYTFDC